MSLDDNKDNDRILEISSLLAGQLAMGAKRHCQKVGAGNGEAENREFLSVITTVISTLAISTYDWLRECGGLEASDTWLEGAVKHTSVNLKAHGADVFIKTIPLFKKGT